VTVLTRPDSRRRSRRVRVCLTALLAAACATAETPDLLERQNVLLITLDTTRADRLGLYGCPVDSSPNLDRVAEEAIVWTRAVSTSSWTLPSHASLFTGRIPNGHGARHDPKGALALRKGIEDRGFPAIRVSSISPAERTLAQRLGDAGYATGGVAAGPWLMTDFGLAAGFDRYHEEGVTVDGIPASQVTDAAIGFLEEFGNGPFFIFLNYFDPHVPRRSPGEHWTAVGLQESCLQGKMSYECWIAGYDAEIHYMDQELGRLFGWLQERGLWDSLLVVITADHGELLGEGGRTGHGRTLTEAELHVPLIVKPPGGEHPPRRENERVSIASVFAYILEQIGLGVPPHAEPPLERSLGRPPIAEAFPPFRKRGTNGHWRAFYRGDYKFLWNSDGEHILHYLASDNPEERNLYHQRRQLADGMQAELQTRLDQTPKMAREPDGEIEIDDATIEALRNLGYVE